MTLSHLVALLTAVSLNANPSPHAIPVTIDPPPAVAGAPVEAPVPMPPVKKRPESLGPVVSSKSAVVIDVASGSVLFAKDAKVVRPIASLTKLMAAMVVLDQGLEGDKTITLEMGDFQETSFFQAGDVLTRRDAFKAMLVGSVNEIANAFARTSPGGRDAFVEAMRAKSQMLGLDSATFADASGVNRGSRASAVDVARLLRSALGYTEIRDDSSMLGLLVRTVATEGAVSRPVNIKATNLLLTSYLNKDPYRIVAAKTGSLPEAGYCLAQTTENADGHQIIAVTLGSVDHLTRFQDVKAMTGWAFETYQWGL
jgi:D-alanyl-D-alanine endopeptidase (penicillin-binding protein 7)